MALSEPRGGDRRRDACRARRDDHAAELDERHRYINRHLSWLDFDTRVLELAEDPSRVLLERAKFLAISSTQPRRVLPGPCRRPDRAAPRRCRGAEPRRHDRRRAALRDPHAAPSTSRRARSTPSATSSSSSPTSGFASRTTRRSTPRIASTSTPCSRTGSSRCSRRSPSTRRIPFPYISDLSLNLAVVVGAPRSTEQRIARVKVPPLLPRFVVMPDGERFVPVEQVIAVASRPPLPGHARRRPVPVPGDPQRRSGARGGGGRGSAHRRAGVPAPPPPFAAGGAPRDRRHDVGGGQAAAHARAGALRRGRVHGRRTARPERPLGPVRAEPARPQGAASRAGDPAGAHPAAGRGG